MVDGPPEPALRRLVRDLLKRPVASLSMRLIPGGASREVWLLELDDDPTARLVLRRDPPGSTPLTSRLDEFRVMEAAHAAGVPVPRPLHFEAAGGVFETAGFLMEHVAGEGVARRILRDQRLSAAREQLPAQVAAALVHTSQARVEFAAAPKDPVVDALGQWEAELDRIDRPMPVVEVGFRWLRRNAPASRPVGLVHGDFRLGNLIVDEQGLRAVVDWELWHLGDPAEDCGWLCLRSWRYGSQLRVAGLAALDTFARDYAAMGGETLTEALVTYWEVFGNVKWAIVCARQAHHYQSGDRPNLELAVIGRRAAEAESDLLDLLAQVA